jgi:hypothetical protein
MSQQITALERCCFVPVGMVPTTRESLCLHTLDPSQLTQIIYSLTAHRQKWTGSLFLFKRKASQASSKVVQSAFVTRPLHPSSPPNATTDFLVGYWVHTRTPEVSRLRVAPVHLTPDTFDGCHPSMSYLATAH